MSYVVAIAKMLAKFSLTVAGFYAAFHFLFNFGDIQALGLGLSIALAIDFASARKPPLQASFTPHRLSLRFHLYLMLIDLRLIDGDEQWMALAGDVPSTRLWGKNSVYHHAISAYMIGTDPDLIHYPILQFYSSHWEFDIELDDLKKEGSYRTWSPEVFIKPGVGGGHNGFHIGIRVKEEWWKANKSAVAEGVVLYEDNEWNFGTVRLTLTVLPWNITHVYYRNVGSGHQAAVKELVAKAGWTNTDLGGAEIGYFGESYEHKYATVWAQHLD